jgi:HNH endonuclease
MSHNLTQEYLQHLLHYDPLTGDWTWINPRSTKLRPGDRAGSLQTKGYWYIKFDGVSHIASRLAFFYMTGAWPENEVDHINRITWDDRWENLRDATRGENNLNRIYLGQSGEAGVYRHTQNNRWIAQYGRIYIGSYLTIEEAKQARQDYIQANELEPTISDTEKDKS